MNIALGEAVKATGIIGSIYQLVKPADFRISYETRHLSRTVEGISYVKSSYAFTTV